MSDGIIGLHHWFDSPPGRYLLAWEQERHDELVADIFGYYALQLGLPLLHGLRTSRIAHRWLALDATQSLLPWRQTDQGDDSVITLLTDAVALPFAEASLDLVLMPHTLEWSAQPHAALREVHRVLLPEGRVVVSGINPWSLWGVHQGRARLYQRLGVGGCLYLPDVGEYITPWRLRDWLGLLGFELESISFGCYRPAVIGEHWLQRYRWMDAPGARWWPILGAAYVVVATKRVHGMQLLAPVWRKVAQPAGMQVVRRMPRDLLNW